MTDDIPQWAMDRAQELMGPTSERVRIQKAFARFITAHEEPPIDPLLVEARELAGNKMAAYSAGGNLQYSTGAINAVRTGNDDNCIQVTIALAALKRGMELAGKQ